MTLRCPECRTRRTTYALMAAHRLTTGHGWCTCAHVPFEGGLGKHRPGTIGCIRHPMAGLHMAMRGGASDEELARIEAELTCPF